MSDEDRVRWDRRYADRDVGSTDDVALPSAFQPYCDKFPDAGRALDLGCGSGGVAVWLAQRGLEVRGYDVSAVAITQARELSERCGVASLCRFERVDLDDGLPAGPRVNVVICNRFRDRRLDRAIVARLIDGGLLAISALSEVGAEPGRFRAKAGELRRAFNDLDMIAEREGDGEAWLLARRLGP